MRPGSIQLHARLRGRFLLLMRWIISGRYAIPAGTESHAPSQGAAFTFQKPIRRVAVIGAGQMALSWAVYYFTRGFEVVAADPARQAGGNSRQELDDLLRAVLDPAQPAATRGTFKIASDLDEALLRADFIQECSTGPVEDKKSLLAEMDKCTRPDSIIASDVDLKGMNDAQRILRFGDRCVIARSFDLPHFNPFTVILNAAGTSPLAIRQAMKFYSRTGRLPIYLRGQVSDDFTSGLLALFRAEAARLRELDIVGERDLDDLGSWAPSLCFNAMVSAMQTESAPATIDPYNKADLSDAAAIIQSDRHLSSRSNTVGGIKLFASPACVP